MNITELIGNNVSPEFKAALTRVEAYKRTLQRHQWHFERNDCADYLQCSLERRWLEREQPVVDPDFALWSQYAPAEFQPGAPT